MESLHPSNSAAQIKAETPILQALNQDLGLALAPKKLKVGDRFVQIDGYDETNGVLCEINARQGALKSAQKDKVASDILKMLLVEKIEGQPMRKIICFASTVAASAFQNKSWLALSVEQFGIEVHSVKVSEQTVSEIEKAQENQRR